MEIPYVLRRFLLAVLIDIFIFPVPSLFLNFRYHFLTVPAMTHIGDIPFGGSFQTYLLTGTVSRSRFSLPFSVSNGRHTTFAL